MAVEELVLKVPSGPMHKTKHGFIWCGLDEINDDIPVVHSPRYVLCHFRLLSALAKEAPVTANEATIIEPDGKVISNAFQVVTPDLAVQFVKRGNGALPMVFRLEHEGVLVCPFVLSPEAEPIIRRYFPKIQCSCEPILVGGRLF